jgi:hypothetical protein
LIVEKEIVILLAHGRKRGIPVSKDDYIRVRDCIVEILKRERETTLTNLIERASVALRDKISGDLGWYILHVKQDMEVQNILTIAQSEDNRRIQLIRLKRNKA